MDMLNGWDHSNEECNNMELLKTLEEFASSNAIAYIHNGETLSYQDLLQKANRLAHYLQSELKDDKTPIPVYGHKDPLMLICFLACVKSGRAYCPIDAGIPKNRIEAILETVQSSIVLSSEELDVAQNGIVDKTKLYEIIDTHTEEIDSSYALTSEDIFYIIFTSGSTGIPKGVQISYANLNHFLEWSIPLANAQSKAKVFINQAPFSFDLSVMDLYTSLGSGGTLFTLDKELQKDYHTLFEALASSKANVWVSTPSFADMCLVDKSFCEDMMPDMETFLFCGEVLTNETARKLLQRFPNAKVINTYGPTESTVAISDVVITEEIIENSNPLPIGVQKPGTWLQIIDEQGNCLPDMEKGEIIIVGNTVGKGYFHNPEQTKKAFFTRVIDGVEMPAYHTGDKGYLEDGMLYYCGRMDLQVKLNGYRIEICDIEQNLMKVDGVENAVVIPNYKEGKIKNLIGYIVYQGDTSQRFQLGQSISASLKQFVPDYMVPKKYVFIDEMPMTNNGKADRKALQEGLS